MKSQHARELKAALFDECSKNGIDCIVLYSDGELNSCEESLHTPQRFSSPGIQRCIAMLEDRMRDPAFQRSETSSVETGRPGCM